LLGVDQPKVSALVRGQLAGFSLERLMRFLNILGRDVQIVVKAKPSRRQRAILSGLAYSKNASVSGPA